MYWAEKAQAKKCDAMAGLIAEGESIVKETKEGAVRDAGIILASKKIEHYEIATYGSLATFAKVLDEKNCLENLKKPLMRKNNVIKNYHKLPKSAIRVY